VNPGGAGDAPAAGLPFSAVVGQDDAKLALVLAALDPSLGGVLLRGDKGSAKTTLARGLAGLLAPGAPFVELPLGATEDRVIGSIDLASLLRDGDPVVRPGLLAAAHSGVLYVDEVNLLADHLVDVLLDVAATGVNRIERDGVAHSHPARFVLVGSMNPEEGELRPQLLDRFGLAVDVRASLDPAVRARAVRRRLDLDRSADAARPFLAQDRVLRARLAAAPPAVAGDDVIDLACAIALEVGAEGLRADLMLCRAAAAHAAWAGRRTASADDVRAVAPLVLGHRRRRSPLEPPGIDPDELARAFDAARQATGREGVDPPPDDDAPGPPGEPDASPGELPRDGSSHDGDRDRGAPEDRVAPPAGPLVPPELRTAARRARAAGNRSEPRRGERGRFVRAETPPADAPPPTSGSVAVVATAAAVAARRAVDGVGEPNPADVRQAVRGERRGSLVILCVDASGSMGADRRMELAKGAVLGLLSDAYQRRDRVALVSFAGQTASVVLRPTASVEIARARLGELPTGGTSPIAEALDAALVLATGAAADRGLDPLVVVVTDGRATGGDDALARSRQSAARLAAAKVAAVVVDAETGPTRLGLAGELAAALGAPCLHLDDLVDGSLERTIRLQLT
jgi:magnesium chelatase subunit D